MGEYYLTFRLCTDTSPLNRKGCLRESIGKRNAFYMINDAAKTIEEAETRQPTDGEKGLC